MRLFKVVVCRGCGNLQVVQADRYTKCFKCGQTIPIDTDTVLFASPDPRKAREKLLALKSTKIRGRESFTHQRGLGEDVF